MNKIKKENKKVLNFIKNWQSENNYSTKDLGIYNSKFNKDFKAFLEAENISKETINFFLN